MSTTSVSHACTTPEDTPGGAGATTPPPGAPPPLPTPLRDTLATISATRRASAGVRTRVVLGTTSSGYANGLGTAAAAASAA
jgi:hypothetical protein